MICLDTNYLILALVPGTSEADRILAWKDSGEGLITPSIAWYEFLCGPVSPVQIQAIRSLLDEIVAFGVPQATTAAHLFRASGRKRAVRVDAMIAATAMASDARLATNNRKDFKAFVAHGLQWV